MSEIRGGGCLCGAVRYQTNGVLRGVVYCHCRQCRKQSGHFYAAKSIDDAQIAIDGADRLTWYRASPSARRGFCGTCGSALFWKRDGSTSVSVLAGSFDDPSGLAESCHIYVEDKGDYYDLCDALPRFAGNGPV